MKHKKRLDHRVQELYPQLSKTHIQSLIMQSKVFVNGQPVVKAGTMIDNDALIVVNAHQEKYVSRAGYKLEKALEHFNIDLHNKVVLDAGLSTGGFADCLLQHGAQKIYGVDVGYGQVHERIRLDPRVVVMERTNLRHLNQLPELVDLVTLDLSFISVLQVLDAVSSLLMPHGGIVILIKPQFEAGKHQVGKGGIVRDPAVHKEVCDRVMQALEARGFTSHGVIESPIEGTTGNKEFLAYFTR